MLKNFLDYSEDGFNSIKRMGLLRNILGTRWVCKKTGDVGVVILREGNYLTIDFSGNHIKLHTCFTSKRGIISPNALYMPTVFGTGYLGIGEHKTSSVSDGSDRCNHSIKYIHFKEMHRRCNMALTDPRYSRWSKSKVHPIFCNYQLFCDWFENEVSMGYYQDGWHLDKDLLGSGCSSKDYSPDTCCFLPPEINSALTKANSIRGDYPIGVSKHGNKFLARIGQRSIGYFKDPLSAFYAYKTEKEKHLKLLADKYKGSISPKAYSALYNYEVNIDD